MASAHHNVEYGEDGRIVSQSMQYFWPTGELQCIRLYDAEGRPHGTEEGWNFDGTLDHQWNFVNGKRHGLQRDFFHFSETLFVTSTYEHGLKHGPEILIKPLSCEIHYYLHGKEATKEEWAWEMRGPALLVRAVK